MASFWDEFGPGLVQAGAGLFGQVLQGKQDKERIKQQQGPLYNQQIGLAGQALTQAGNLDPTQAAADVYKQWEGMTEQDRLAQQQALQRQLVAQGQSGVATHGAVGGTVPTPGTAINPQFAALYAAQEGAKQKAAFDAMETGQRRLDNSLNRAGMLQRNAYTPSPYVAPSRPSTGQQLIGAAGKLLSQPGALKSLGGLFQSGIDWLGGGGSGSSSWDFQSPGWYGSAYGQNDDWLYDI